MTYIMAMLRGLDSLPPSLLIVTEVPTEVPVVLTSDRPVSAELVTAPPT